MDEAEIINSPPTLPIELLPAADLAPRSSSPERLARLQRRVAELEADLEKSRMDHFPASEDPSDAPLSPATTFDPLLQEENARLTSRVSALEAEINTRAEAARDEADQLSSQIRDSAEQLEVLRKDMDVNNKKSAEKIAELESTMSKLTEENEKAGEAHDQLKIAKAVSDEEVVALKDKLELTTAALEADKKELAQEVDELRLAGQVS